MRNVVIGGKTIPCKEMTFNMLSEFEELGVSISKIDDNIMRTARAYIAICGNMSEKAAGELIEKHVIDGGTLEDIYNELKTAIEESRFFQALRKKAETATEE